MNISGKHRAAIFISVLWVFFALILANNGYKIDWNNFLMAGAFPVGLTWGIVWVSKGSDSNQNTNLLNILKSLLLTTSGIFRVAISISIIWFIVASFAANSRYDFSWSTFLIAIFPIVSIWSAAWIVKDAGDKKKP